MPITPEMARAELARRELQRRGIQNGSSNDGPQTQEGISSIPGDIANSAANLVMGLGEKAMQLPEEISEGAQQVYNDPVKGTARAAGNVASGFLEGGKQLFNLPFNLASYLGKKGVPGFASGFPFADDPRTLGDFAEKFKIGDTGLQKSVLGNPQKGDELWQDLGGLAPLALGAKGAGITPPAVTSKGLMNQLSKEKAKQLSIANKDYTELFTDASSKGLTHAQPLKEATKSANEIIKNSIPKYHDSFKKYLQSPTIENAHWAQSELGAFQRHLDKISQRNGLTPSQVKTYKAVKDARAGIKKSMFSDNALGKNPAMAKRYEDLASKYKENVIPYTSLEDLSEFDAGKLRPKTAVKNLLNDEEFMIKLSKKYPGFYLHTPLAKKIAMGTGGLLGYEEIKRLLK